MLLRRGRARACSEDLQEELDHLLQVVEVVGGVQAPFFFSPLCTISSGTAAPYFTKGTGTLLCFLLPDLPTGGLTTSAERPLPLMWPSHIHPLIFPPVLPARAHFLPLVSSPQLPATGY